MATWDWQEAHNVFLIPEPRLMGHLLWVGTCSIVQQCPGECEWRERLVLLPVGLPGFACGWRQSCRKRAGLLALRLLQLEESQQQ